MSRKLTIAEVARYPRPGQASPRKIQFHPGGRIVNYLASQSDGLVQEMWAYDIETGIHTQLTGLGTDAQEEQAFSREEELRRERSRMREVGVTDYQYAKASESPVLLAQTASGLVTRHGDGSFEPLAGSEGAIAPQISPDGRYVAYVRDRELQVQETTGTTVRTLTSGAGPGITNGLAEFVAQEEMGRGEGFWWSHDGRYLAYERVDTCHIPIYPILHQGKDTIDIEEHAYPFAGAENARVQLGVVSVEGGDTAWMNLGADSDIYLARVAWTPDGALTAQIETRDQQTLMLVRFDMKTGAATPLITEHSKPWVNLNNDLCFLKSGEFIWASEKSGFRHLYLHDAVGEELRQVTQGDWMVTRVIAMDEDMRVIYFEATKESVLECHLYAISLDGGDVKKLTSQPGWHEAYISPDFQHIVDSWSSLDQAPTVALLNMDGSGEKRIFEQPTMTPESLGLQTPELITVSTRDGVTLHAALYNPPDMDEGRCYPLVVSVYGGPHAQTVANLWGLTTDMRAQYLAQHGFVVLKADNRGSANRGLAFEGAIARNLGDIEVQDQVDAVRAVMSEREYVDGERVGIYGWSYGGYMTLMALLRAPELFKVGVAGAPVTNWDGYDTFYTERYMETPASNAEGYRNSAAMTHVDNLQGKLLLVHGMIDENVHFRHTGRLLGALAAAQKPYDLLLFPEERHMPRDAKGLEYQESRVLGYFEENL